MRIHREGYIQCRQMEVDLPDILYRWATNSSQFMTLGLEDAVQKHLGIELTGVETFRIIEFKARTVTIQIDSQWVQPTRA